MAVTSQAKQSLLPVTSEESRIVWGCPPGESGVHRGEVSREQKLKNLDLLHQRYGRIDAGQDLVEIFRPDVGYANVEGGQ